MTDSIDDAETDLILALAGTTQVDSYMRRTKDGRLIKIAPYERRMVGSSLKPGQKIKDAFGKVRTVKSASKSSVEFTDGTKGNPKGSYIPVVNESEAKKQSKAQYTAERHNSVTNKPLKANYTRRGAGEKTVSFQSLSSGVRVQFGSEVRTVKKVETEGDRVVVTWQDGSKASYAINAAFKLA